MGSLFKSNAAGAVPAPPSTVIDQINGVEQVPQVNADGSVTYITRALPLTEEQQAQKDQLTAIMQDSLGQIQALSAADYTPDAETQKVLDAWQSTQQKTLDTQVKQRTQSEEQALAQRGLGDSTAAQDVRRQRLLDQQDAALNISNTKDEMASSVRDQKLALQQNLYNIAANATDAATANTAKAAANAQSSALALNAQRQASILDYYNSQTANPFSSAFGSSLGSSLGKGVGDNSTAQVGAMLGSLFLRG